MNTLMWRPPVFRQVPLRLAQQQPPTQPAPTQPAPSKKPDPILLLAAGTAGGAAIGLATTYILPLFEKKKTSVGAKGRMFAALGGAFGGLMGAMTVMAFTE